MGRQAHPRRRHDKQQVLSSDQLRLEVDAYARYRVVDPLKMVITARAEAGSRPRCARSSARRSATSSASGRSPTAHPRARKLRTISRPGCGSSPGSTVSDRRRAHQARRPARRRPLNAAYAAHGTARQQEAITQSGAAQGANRHRLSAPRPMQRLPAPMPTRSARIRNSTISTARCKPYRDDLRGADGDNPRRLTERSLRPDKQYLEEFVGQVERSLLLDERLRDDRPIQNAFSLGCAKGRARFVNVRTKVSEETHQVRYAYG